MRRMDKGYIVLQTGVRKRELYQIRLYLAIDTFTSTMSMLLLLLLLLNYITSTIATASRHFYVHIFFSILTRAMN